MIRLEVFPKGRNNSIIVFLASPLFYRMFHNKPRIGWIYLCLIAGNGLLPILCFSNVNQISPPQTGLPAEARKFAEKPNATKKVPALEDRNDLDDVQTNQIPVRSRNAFVDIFTSSLNFLITQIRMIVARKRRFFVE